MAELPVEMPKLLKFPMGKLCYDLILEVIDELEPKDVAELIKIDRRFRWILLQKPARIFGKQIHLISVQMDDRDESHDDGRKRYQDLVFIMKFAESKPLPFPFFSHKVLLLSQVERCSVLDISENGGFIDGKLSALKKAFANLKQVDELEVNIWGNNLNDFLWDSKAEVTDRASLRFSRLQGETHQQLMLSLINGSLQNCKMISVDLCPDLYPTLFSALSKTQLELFVTEVPFGSVESTIELILTSGIPSENKEAACFVQGEMTVGIENLIKNFLEIREINEPNKAFIWDTMMGTLRKHGIMFECCDRSGSVSDDSRADSEHSHSDSEDSHSDSDHSRSDSDDSLHSMELSPIKRRVQHYVYLHGPFDCYLKRIDEKRDCIYVVNDNFFFAKFVIDSIRTSVLIKRFCLVMFYCDMCVFCDFFSPFALSMHK